MNAAALLLRTPATARRLNFVGPSRAVFEQACRARNPAAVLADAAGLDALVAEELTVGVLGQAGRLGPDGVLVAGLPVARPQAMDAGLRALEAAGWRVLRLHPAASGDEAYFDDAASDLAPAWRASGQGALQGAADVVLVARRAAASRPPAMHVRMSVYAPALLEVRTRLPMQALRSDPDLVVACGPPLEAIPMAPPDSPKVLIVQRPRMMDLAAWRATTEAAIAGGWLLVLEQDDHPDLIAGVRGGQAPPQAWARLGCVHAVQTSTEALAAVFRPHNPQVAVFPNAVFDLPPFAPAPGRRVFYGAAPRGGFAAEVARSLAPAVEAHPDLSFEVVGDRAVFDALPTAAKRFHDFLPYRAYLDLMATCSVCLSPLDAAPHQQTKSDAKFLDASARGLLTIASPTVYGGVIRDGETGLIAAALEDWAPRLAAALADAPARDRMARAAWTYVRDHRMFAGQVAQRRNWYAGLWARRDDLDRAVRARMANAPSAS